MTTLALIAATIAATAVVAFWLWTRPDVRAWLAGHWARLLAAVKPYRGRLVAAVAVVAILVVLVFAGIWVALPWAITVGLIALCREAMRASDAMEQEDAEQIRLLEDGINRVARTRDAYADALNHVLRTTDLQAARAVANSALATGTYPGDLAAARDAHEACELELEEARVALDAARAELDDVRSWLTTERRPA